MIPPGLFRLLLAFVVVVHHSFPLRLGSVAVGLFFVLSGFWISRMWCQSYSKIPSPYFTFLVSRWWRLAPLFIVVQLIAAAMAISIFTSGESSAICDWRWWITQVTVLGSTQFNRLLPPSWSLDVEAQFYMLAPLLVAVVAKVPRFATWGICAVFFALSVVAMLKGASFETPHVDLYLWLFLTGVMAEQFKFRPSTKLAWLSAVVTFGVVGVAFCFPETRSLVWRHGAWGMGSAEASIIGKLFPFFLILVALPLALSTVYRPSGGFDRWLGDLSYPLYLFHWIPRDIYHKVMDSSNSVWMNLIYLLSSWAMAIGGAVLLLWLVDRPAQAWRKKWLKQRRHRLNGPLEQEQQIVIEPRSVDGGS